MHCEALNSQLLLALRAEDGCGLVGQIADAWDGRTSVRRELGSSCMISSSSKCFSAFQRAS